jgi:very-short-patch-repair endonuclease
MKKDHPYHDESMYKGAPPDSFAKAKFLRDNMTDAKKLLWEKLKNNQLKGFKFRRQHPIHIYIVDFYCHKLKLVIEIDGGYHNSKDQKILDAERSEILKFQKLEVIRFTNEEVLGNIEFVMRKIEEKLDFGSPLHPSYVCCKIILKNKT